jgi:glycosyltransferase involved in cell wall biosynthesis
VPLGEWEGSHILVLNFLHVLVPIAEEIYLITGNYPEDDLPSPKIQLTNVRNDPMTGYPKRRLITRAVKYVATQLKMSYRLAKIASQVDMVIFFIGGCGLLLPMLTAKLRRKKTILIAIDAGAVISRHVYRKSFGGMGGLITYGIVSVLQRLNYRLCDRIVVYSPILVQEFGLERYKHKISIAHEHFLDFDRFKLQKPLNERDNLVGYIGRLSQEKGILNFMEAIPKVVETRDKATFLIVGAGQLRPQVEEYANKLNNKVKFVGWIPHDELPEYLNKLKLLVLPSYTEGLPNIMLEAMACGTPVLATPVGATPDIIKDGETGFIMENNSPECIAENIVRAVNHPNLEQIARNAHALVEREFTHEAAVEGYKNIFLAI